MGQFTNLKSPIFLALDVDDEGHALELAEQVSDYVGGFKVGPRLTYKYGARIVKQLSQIAPVFVDNKYHDIPNTVLSAIKATFEAGATFTTVHSSNGPEALKQIKKLQDELAQIRPFKILCRRYRHDCHCNSTLIIHCSITR